MGMLRRSASEIQLSVRFPPASRTLFPYWLIIRLEELNNNHSLDLQNLTTII